jgi:acyl-CoA thioester hydrolase
VTLNDKKLRAERRFQVIRLDDGRTLLRARSFYVCTDLTTGKPTRMPAEFKTGFQLLPAVAEALKQSAD